MGSPPPAEATAGRCPSCGNRVKAEAHWDTNGGDFWHCAAEPVLPTFAGPFFVSRTQMLVNLNSFEAGHPCADFQNARTCALWQPDERTKWTAGETPVQHHPV